MNFRPFFFDSEKKAGNMTWGPHHHTRTPRPGPPPPPPDAAPCFGGLSACDERPHASGPFLPAVCV